MIKKYSTSNIDGIFKISSKKSLTCVKCKSEIKIAAEIDISNLILDDKDLVVCGKCKLKNKE